MNGPLKYCYISQFSTLITNNLSVIRHAWHFYYASVLVIRCYAEASLLRASHLNWALGDGQESSLFSSS